MFEYLDYVIEYLGLPKTVPTEVTFIPMISGILLLVVVRILAWFKPTPPEQFSPLAKLLLSQIGDPKNATSLLHGADGIEVIVNERRSLRIYPNKGPGKINIYALDPGGHTSSISLREELKKPEIKAIYEAANAIYKKLQEERREVAHKELLASLGAK